MLDAARLIARLKPPAAHGALRRSSSRRRRTAAPERTPTRCARQGDARRRAGGRLGLRTAAARRGARGRRRGRVPQAAGPPPSACWASRTGWRRRSGTAHLGAPPGRGARHRRGAPGRQPLLRHPPQRGRHLDKVDPSTLAQTAAAHAWLVWALADAAGTLNAPLIEPPAVEPERQLHVRPHTFSVEWWRGAGRGVEYIVGVSDGRLPSRACGAQRWCWRP